MPRPFRMKKQNGAKALRLPHSTDARPLSGEGISQPNPVPLVVLHVDDDSNDTLLLQAAARKAGARFTLLNVPDGEQAMTYLSGMGPYADRSRYPLPALIILDLKMPRLTGVEILKWI